MIFFILLVLLINGVFCGKSPHGEEYLARFDSMNRIDPRVVEDAKLDVMGLLTKYGYSSEEHIVKTEDGYLLTMHRILNRKESQRIHKPVVLLMHGLLSSSADWINSGPDNGFGYLLADQGFDVWMGNARGNSYSRNHTTISPDDSNFWMFSWNEIGYFDLPAMVDKILHETGEEQLHYVGHSQGTTSFFVMGSERPEYNKKIKSMHALAPIAYMSKLQSPLVVAVAPFIKSIKRALELFGLNEFLPQTELNALAADLLCKDGSILQPVCTNFIFLLCGYNPELLNSTMLPIYMSHTPAGSSSRQLIHYGQEYNSGKFQKFDYGKKENLKKYKQSTPPDYNLKLVTAPVFLHYSQNDWLSHPDDVKQLNKELGNSIGLFEIRHKKFNHLDYMWAINVRNLLYKRIVNLILAFE